MRALQKGLKSVKNDRSSEEDRRHSETNGYFSLCCLGAFYSSVWLMTQML